MDEHRVTPLELFFDLVFVFAITQVTAALADDPSWEGLVRGLLLCAAMWQAWVGYAWLTNSVDPDVTPVRLTVFAAMAAMLVAALALPGAFGENGVVFGCAYLVVRALHVILYHLATRHDAQVHRAVVRLAGPILLGPSLLLVAGFLDGTVQGLVWIAALAIDYGGPLIAGPGGWRVAPGHFAERHGLIVIIALGESIVALGVGAAELPIDAGIVVAAVLGVVIAAALWWAYFDVVALVAERRLHEAQGAERARLARDSYSYLHLPMIAGIILLALGVKKTLADVGVPLKDVPAVAMCGGTALYLLGHVGFRLRNVGTLNRPRLTTAALLVLLILPAREIAALTTVALIAAALVALITYEALRYRDARARIRASLRAA